MDNQTENTDLAPQLTEPPQHADSSAEQVVPEQQAAMPPMTLVHVPGKKFFIILAIIFSLLFFSSGVLLVLAAYDIVPFGSSSFRTGLADSIQGLPFMPKTPFYVARKVSLTLAKTNKFTFDLGVEGENFENLLPFSRSRNTKSSMKFTVKGKLDVTNIDKPNMDINVSNMKDIDFDLRAINKETYFKLNILPDGAKALITFIGYPEKMADDLTGRWLSLPSSDYESSEKTKMRKKEEIEEWNNLIGQKMLDAYKEKTFTPEFSIVSDTLDKKAVRKMTISMDKKALDEFEEMASEVDKTVYGEKETSYLPIGQIKPKKARIVLWVNDDYFVEKFTLDTVLEAPYYGDIISSLPGYAPVRISSSDQQGQVGIMPVVETIEIPVRIQMNLRDIGKEITVEKPKDAVLFSEYMDSLYAKYREDYLPVIDPVGQLSKANNMKRRSDINAILNAVNQYTAANKGNIPPGITQNSLQISKSGADLCAMLVPEYTLNLPVDPYINTGKNVDELGCSESYYTGYMIYQSPVDSSITVTAPYAELDDVISVTR